MRREAGDRSAQPKKKGLDQFAGRRIGQRIGRCEIVFVGHEQLPVDPPHDPRNLAAVVAIQSLIEKNRQRLVDNTVDSDLGGTHLTKPIAERMTTAGGVILQTPEQHLQIAIRDRDHFRGAKEHQSFFHVGQAQQPIGSGTDR